MGYFGSFGGRFVSELLMPALEELESGFRIFRKEMKSELNHFLKEYGGRPSNLYYAASLSKKWNAKVYLKREDLNHTGSHKINNVIGQGLLAKFMNKKRIIAETGAGQHGVATATIGALLNLKTVVYMGKEDMRRQSLNVFRMQLLGAEVIGSGDEKGTLRDAVNDALRDWAKNIDDTHYLVGSVIGPHPFPYIVREFQSVIGKETRRQILKKESRLPDALFACVGGGSNSMGMFYPFLEDDDVKKIGVEAGGRSFKKGEHAATLQKGKPGILHGALTYLIQDKEGMISDVHSISAGLDYPGIGPEHSFYHDTNQVDYVSVNDRETLMAFRELSETEGIIPALESSHAVAYAKKWVQKAHQEDKIKDPLIVINLSGRGDKDVAEVKDILKL